MKFSLSIVLSTLLVGSSNAWSIHSSTTSKHSRSFTTTTSSTTSSTTSTALNSSPTESSTANDSNVVFRPSTDPEAFDSSKVGTARIHRYARDTDDQSQYIMWYHGRGTDIDESKSLPPLSTGRVGRATSRNGLHWVREEEGSASEDVTGVSLGLNKESWWGFDTAHVGLGQVMLPMTTPAVMTEGGVYLMYYMGGSYEETPIGQYLDNAPPGSDSTMIQGMKMKIGVALSQDGISFGRVEGDDPSGAIMSPYDKSDPNMRSMQSVRDDDDSLLNLEEELYCGWPEVTVNDISEEERAAGTKKKSFFMYYSTMLKDTKEKAIACAVSEDGFRWDKRGICIRPDTTEEGLDNGGCARSSVIRNAVFDEDKGTWELREGWTMFYEGVSKEDNKHRILAATSMDGREWTKTGMVFDIGEDGAWDSHGVGAANVLRLDDGTSRMYYTGQGKDGSTAIGVAKCDLGSDVSSTMFVREQANITFL